MHKSINTKYLTKEQRNKAIKSIISFFFDERNEEIGIIAAEEVLEFIETEIAAQIYSKALLDAKTIAKQQFEELDFKLTEKTLK
ncbi:MAG: DUF2164 domain-containing protein [Microgenomates group bacterium]